MLAPRTGLHMGELGLLFSLSCYRCDIASYVGVCDATKQEEVESFQSKEYVPFYSPHK